MRIAQSPADNRWSVKPADLRSPRSARVEPPAVMRDGLTYLSPPIVIDIAPASALLERVESTKPQDIPRRPHTVYPAATSTVRHYKADDSIFIDDAYLIKGIAGRIFWKLVQTYAQSGRVDFTNKEIRLDTSLQLPEIKDNLEARLILPRRRLQDRCDFVSLTQVGRGQFRLEVQRQLTLEERL